MTTRCSFVLERLPSNVYHLTWNVIEFIDNEPRKCEIFFATKAAIVKMVNSHKTYPEIKEFLRHELQSGNTIK